MIKIAGIWEVGWNAPIMEVSLWEMVCREFCVDQFYMTPISGILNKYLTERQTMEEVLAENMDLEHVYLHEKAEQTLCSFTHPEKALYLFGRVGPSPMHLKREGVDHAVRIVTPENGGTLWPHQIACLLLHDRFRKSWQ